MMAAYSSVNNTELRNHNSKEILNLLSMSESESASGELQQFTFSQPKRKVRTKKRQKSYPSSSHIRPSSSCTWGCTTVSAIIVMMTFGMGILAWFSLNLHMTIDQVRKDLQQVEASKKEMPEVLHDYHRQLMEVQGNQTSLVSEVESIKKKLQSMTVEISSLKGNLQNVQSGLKNSPQLAELPKDFSALQSSVTTFGSEMSDLKSVVADMQNKQETLETRYQGIDAKLSTMKIKLSNNSSWSPPNSGTNPSSSSSSQFVNIYGNITKLSDEVDRVNTTISNQINWATGDIHKIQTDLGDVQDNLQNVSVRVRSLEQTCSTLVSNIQHLNDSQMATLQRVGSNSDLMVNLTKQTGNLETHLSSVMDHLNIMSATKAKTFPSSTASTVTETKQQNHEAPTTSQMDVTEVPGTMEEERP